jgi:hypothetical protein
VTIGEQSNKKLLHYRFLPNDCGTDALFEIEDLLAGSHES